MQFSQLIGEKIFYKQKITGTDVIASATWTVSVNPGSAGSVGTPINDNTSSTVLFGATAVGLYVITGTLTFQSGLVLMPQFKVNVVLEKI